MIRLAVVGLALAAAPLALADRQVLAPGTGTQDAIVIDTGADGICDTTAAKDDIQAATVGGGAPNENQVTCGPNRIAESTAAGDDLQLVAVGGDCQNQNTNVVDTGANGIAETVLAGDDEYDNDIVFGGAPANEPCVITGANGVADTSPPVGDDEVDLFVGQAEVNTNVITCGLNNVADTTANNVEAGDDVQVVAVGDPCATNAVAVDSGPDGVATTRAEGVDLRLETVKPVKITIKKGKPNGERRIKLSVRNVEFGGPASRSFRIEATRGNCPRGTIGEVDADAKAGGVQGTASVSQKGRAKALVTVRAALEDVTVADKRNPFRCTFNLAVVAIDTDPEFDDGVNTRTNRATVQLDVIDKNDL